VACVSCSVQDQLLASKPTDLRLQSMKSRLCASALAYTAVTAGFQQRFGHCMIWLLKSTRGSRAARLCSSHRTQMQTHAGRECQQKWCWSLQYFSSYRANSKLVTYIHTHNYGTVRHYIPGLAYREITMISWRRWHVRVLNRSDLSRHKGLLFQQQRTFRLACLMTFDQSKGNGDESECKCLTCNQKPTESQFSLLHEPYC